jgi:hypothetical protein
MSGCSLMSTNAGRDRSVRSLFTRAVEDSPDGPPTAGGHCATSSKDRGEAPWIYAGSTRDCAAEVKKKLNGVGSIANESEGLTFMVDGACDRGSKMIRDA